MVFTETKRGTHELMLGDVSKADIAEIFEREGKIDILINNAGQFVPGSVYNEAEGNLEQMMNINLFSAYHLTRALLPAMMERRSGHIFNICSIAALKA